MGLIDFARGSGGGGGGEGSHDNMVYNQGNQRRGGGGHKSALIQRYLAAIEAEDAVELLLPTSPSSSRRRGRRPAAPLPPPISPSGRSRSSHTTKSTKYTVRTAGSDSAEVLTPASSSFQMSPLIPRRKSTIATASSPSQQRRLVEERASSSVKHVATSPSQHDTTTTNTTSNSTRSPLRRGLFPRSLLRNSPGHSSSQQPPPMTHETSLNHHKSSLIRKWNLDHHANGNSSTRAIPSSKLPPPQRRRQRQNSHHQYPANDDDDDDNSSLSSRRTTESQHRRRSLRRNGDDDDDTSSYDDEDDDEESTRSGHYRMSQQHHVAVSPQKVRDSNNKKVVTNHFSIEQTIDQAMEKGLDMILNSTNGWTCSVPAPSPPQKPAATTPHLPRSARDTQQMSTTKSPSTTPPAHLRRKQRHEELLQHSLSVDTPRSDVTGAATEIATNRAMDLAWKRIRDLEYADQQPPSPPVASPTVELSQGPPPPSTLSSSNVTTMSRVKQVAQNFERNTLQNVAPSIMVHHQTTGLNSRTYTNMAPTSATTSNKERLGQHFHEMTSRHYSRPLQRGERSVETIKSLSSSVGVEIDDRASRMNVCSTYKNYSDVQTGANMNRIPPPSAKDDFSNDWTEAPLPYGPENGSVQQKSANRRSYLGSARTVLNTIPSTPVSSRYKIPTEPCMSPPQIVRKSHSYDQVSPDPIFCSKSMSMSINSGPIFSPQQSSNASVEASFQSEDALFMEKLDESVSTVVSIVHKNDDPVTSVNVVRTLDVSNISNHLLPKVTPEMSGHTETTYDSHTDEDVTNSIDNDRNSPYMEILGIRGRFPAAPVYSNRDTTTMPQPLQYFSSPQVNQTRLVAPLAPYDSPSPPPLTDDALSISRDCHTSGSFNIDELPSNGKFGQEKSLYGGKTVYHIPVARPEPVRSRPSQLVGLGKLSNRSTKYSGNSALATKLSRTVASLNEDDCEMRSADVKSIRSAFESILGSHEVTIESDDNDDDDVASVRSLRERFEPPPVVSPTENGISKARAVFERGASNNKNRPDYAANSLAGRLLDRRVQQIDKIHRQQEYTSNPSDELDDDRDNGIDSVVVNASTSTPDRKPLTVAERVRAFSGKNKNEKPYHYSNNGPRKVDAISSSKLSETATKEPAEISFSSKRYPRNRLSTLRALGGKAFVCGPAKAPSDSFDFDALANVSSNSKELLQEIQKNAPKELDSSVTQDVKADILDGPSHTTSLPDACETEKIVTPLEMRDLKVNPSQSAIKSRGFQSSNETKPLWMVQREKILSRSRNFTGSRVAAAACESKRETALISSNLEKEITGCNDKKVVVYAGEVRQLSLKAASNDEADVSSVAFDKVQKLGSKTKAESSNETIDKYHIDLQPSYQLRRSASENVKPVYKLHRTSSGTVNQLDNECNEQLLPFCLQSPISNEEYENMNYIEATEDPTIKLDSLYDEKKEENEFENLQRTEASKDATTAESNMDDHVMPEIIQYKQNREAQAVIKPVARKPYVRPVPMKPMLKSMPVIPFGRSVSDPTSTTLPTKLGMTANAINDADSRFVPRAMIDKRYATLELPNLVEGHLEPEVMDDVPDSTSESSEFSDGVTLDLSIADVSNLTNPTALVSKIGGHHHEEDRARSEMSNDDRPLASRSLARNKRDDSGDAKQSEASSSQTSEAAAPLLARAMRTFPLSDEISTDSFFRARAIAAKQQWNTMQHSNRSMPSYALFEENSMDDESRYSSDLDRMWDIRQVESLFPTSGSSKVIERIHGSAVHGAWQPFPLSSESNESPKAVTGNALLNSEKDDAFIANMTPSRSKTPTRRNTTRIVQVPSLNATVLLPTLQFETLNKEAAMSNKPLSESDRGTLFQGDDGSEVGASVGRPLESEASHPLLSTTSSNVSGRTSRTIVSNLLSSSTPGFYDDHSVKHSTTTGSTIPVSSRSTVSMSTVSSYGPKHSALLERIHALKESRLRRATRMAPHNRRPSTALAYQAAEQQSYY